MKFLVFLIMTLFGINLNGISQITTLDSLAKFSIDGKWGLVDCSGNVVLKNVFKSISLYQCDDFFSTRRYTKENYVNRRGMVEITGNYDFLFGFYNGISRAISDHKIGFINSKGEVIIPFNYGSENIKFDQGNFIEEVILVIDENFKYGYINLQELTIIPFLYDDAKIFQDGNAIVGQKDQWSTILYGTIDKNNNVQIPLEYNYLEYQYNDLYYAGKFFNFG